jgi:hypothetical protein
VASFPVRTGSGASSASRVTPFWRGSSAVELSPRRDDKTVVPGPPIVFVAVEATKNHLLGGNTMKRRHPHRQRPLVSADERAADQVLGSIRSCAQRLHTAAWSCDSLAPTVTRFVADLRSGYSTYDMPPEELREAAFAAGELTAIAALNGWSIAAALAQISVRDQLFNLHQAAPGSVVTTQDAMIRPGDVVGGRGFRAGNTQRTRGDSPRQQSRPPVATASLPVVSQGGRR